MILRADERDFVFVYDTSLLPPGATEYEQWATWSSEKDSDRSFDRFDFRHELEFGVTERVQLALYLSDWRIQDGNSVEDGADWRDIAVEGIYQLTDPLLESIGSALYGEILVGDEVLGLEGKLILQKVLPPWNLAYNLAIEAEWEGEHYEEDEGEFEQSLGASYEISPRWSVGAELLHIIESEDWEGRKPDLLYAGPNAACRGDGWWLTLAPLLQLTDRDEEANLQVRLIFGIDF